MAKGKRGNPRRDGPRYECSPIFQGRAVAPLHEAKASHYIFAPLYRDCFVGTLLATIGGLSFELFPVCHSERMSRSPEQSEGEESDSSQPQKMGVIAVSQSPEHGEGEARQSRPLNYECESSSDV